MKRFCLFIAAILAWILPIQAQQNQQNLLIAYPHTAASSTWSLVQFKWNDSNGSGTGGGTCSGSGSTCAVTVSSIGAGHILLAFGLSSITSGNVLNSISGETSTHCANCSQFDGSIGSIDARYVLSAAGGETSITCTLNAAAGGYNGCGIVEYSYSGPSASFDVAGSAVDSACTTACAAQSLTLSGSNDAIVQIASPANALTTFSGAAYTNPKQFYSGVGIAGAINQSSGTSPGNWNQTGGAGTVLVVGIAVKGN